MEFLGVGPLELFFILIIALIVLGPKDMVKAGRTLGRLARRTILSPTWVSMQRRIRSLPYEMMREAGLEEEDLKLGLKREDLDLGLDRSTLGMDIKDLGTKPAGEQQPPVPNQAPPDASGEVPPEWLGKAAEPPDADIEENTILPPSKPPTDEQPSE